MLECVVNVSEGRDPVLVALLAAAAGPSACLDVHRDAYHNRSVLTLAGHDVEEKVRQVARAVVDHLDLSTHDGVHPRLGVLDVVPFVALAGSTLTDATAARDRFAHWAGTELSLPCFLYGPERSLPEVRRGAFSRFAPDTGPPRGDPRSGACCVGAREPMVAYNVWLDGPAVHQGARRIATVLRSDQMRTLSFAVGRDGQVSFNLVEPLSVGPEAAYDAVAVRAAQLGLSVTRGELVGLMPAAVLGAIPSRRWSELGLAPHMTIEARLAPAGPAPA
ncbi:MAG: hypothetical protein ACRD0I_01515 [Acidimicrobiales bacterium]